jgi:uncharacterized NAD-dependent epimerase/dehydratase family protein
MKFLLVENGKHMDEQGVIHSKGSVVESSKDLVGAFPGRFQQIPSAVETQDTEDHESQEVHVIEPGRDFGRDVTSQFEAAVEAGFLVYRKGTLHTVVDEDEPNLPLNEKGLKKGEVKKFLSGYLEA